MNFCCVFFSFLCILPQGLHEAFMLTHLRNFQKLSNLQIKVLMPNSLSPTFLTRLRMDGRANSKGQFLIYYSL